MIHDFGGKMPVLVPGKAGPGYFPIRTGLPALALA